MSAAMVMRLPLSVDLSGFVELLERLQVPHRVSEEGNEQVLWTLDHLVEDVRQLYQRYPEGNPDIELAPLPGPSKPPRPSLAAQVKASKATAAVLLLCLVAAGLTGLGENVATLSWLTFLDFRVQGDYLYFTPLFTSLEQGQWWRLFSPMLVHFGLLHLAMNGLWYWELGRRIELRQGAWALVSLTLLFSLVSNVAQFVFGGPSLFGGLSGVLYGLLGHLWLYQWLAPAPLYRMPRGVLVMMLVWLLLCLVYHDMYLS